MLMILFVLSFVIVARKHEYIMRFRLKGNHPCPKIALLLVSTCANNSPHTTDRIEIVSYSSIVVAKKRFSYFFIILCLSFTEAIFSDPCCLGELPACHRADRMEHRSQGTPLTVGHRYSRGIGETRYLFLIIRLCGSQ